MDMFETYRILGSAIESQEKIMNFYAKNMSNLENVFYKKKDNNFHKKNNNGFKLNLIQKNNFNKTKDVDLKIKANKKKSDKLMKINNLNYQKQEMFEDTNFIDNYLGYIESSNQYKMDVSMLNSNKSIILNTLSIIEK